MIVLCVAGAKGEQASPQTVAEKSGFKATSTSQEVVRFVQDVVKQSGHVRRADFGKTVEGRPMVAAIAAQPPVSSPADLKDDPRAVVLLLGNIHSGECAGKEALLMLLRELGQDRDHALLKNLVIIFVPNYSADANDRMGKNHRPGQVGPEDGMGLRETVQGYDLNRDFMKLDSVEGRALVQLINKWDPHLLIDTHTTNGSRHQYHLTYDIPHNPASSQAVREFMRTEMMPAVTRELDKEKIPTFFYGNYNRDQTQWRTFGDLPRYGTEYVGLRGRMSILSEAHKYVRYRERIVASREFVRQCLNFFSQRKDDVRKLLADERAKMISKGKRPEIGDHVSIQSEIAALEGKVTIKGLKISKDKEGKTVEKPQNYEVEHWAKYIPTLEVQRPFAYLLPQDESRVADRLVMHGIEIYQLNADVELPVECYQVQKVERSTRPYQQHQLAKVEATKSAAKRTVPGGTYVIPTSQALGNLVVYLLEPQSDDGLATWNFFDPGLAAEQEFPALRLPAPAELKMRRVRRVQPAMLLNLNQIYGPEGRVSFSGTSSSASWLPDSQTYLKSSGDRSVAVDAETGAVERAPEKLPGLAAALEKLPEIDAETARSLAGRRSRTSKDRKGVLISWSSDLFYWREGTERAVRLTHSSDVERHASLSPDGKMVAFVRDNNLFVIGTDGGPERPVTTEGNEHLLHGILDWVYQEELYGRGQYQAYWWSPDSKWIALLRLDESPVPEYTVADNIPYHPNLEVTGYPIAGDPLPRVDLGIVPAAGGDVRWVDHFEYSPTEYLISRVDWSADSKSVVYQLQNREQTWLDLRSASPSTASSKLLFRETSGGWVSVLGPPQWLKDGSFLWLSERDGNQHIYHVVKDGKKVVPVTSGPWDVASYYGIDEENQWVYFSAAKNNGTSTQAFRIKLDGQQLTCLTPKQGSHSIRFNDAFSHFIHTHSSTSSLSQTCVRRADGKYLHTVAPNLDDRLKYYKIREPEFVQVPTRDGLMLDGMIIKPYDFDPAKKYPVLCHVYSGPQSPTVRNRWGGSTYLWHQLLAQKGYVIWFCDNRSASTKGAKHAWKSHRRLGQEELKDIEDGLSWLKRHSWIDGDRIGIWGWSYGGYMTSYALTHSKSFKAGIAGAPVTDWRNYDAIYTERFMGLPQNNPDGYRDASAVAAADKLHGRLLLIHGTIDDNVHISNTLQMAYALQNAGKQFEIMMYPKSRHGVSARRQSRHLRELMTTFILKHL